MSGLIWLGVLAVYVAGLFPAAVRMVRWSATRGRCHHEATPTRRDTYNAAYRSWCQQFHHSGCWRVGGAPDVTDLKAAPAALIWPVAIFGLAILAQARKQPTVSDLQKQIADLEAGLGIGGTP